MKFFTNWIESLVDRAVTRMMDSPVFMAELTDKVRASCPPDNAAVAASLTSKQLRDIAKEVQEDVTYSMDLDDVAERLAEKVDIDTTEIASSVARRLDMDDIVKHVADEIDMGQVCEQCAEKIEVDEDKVIERTAEMLADNISQSDIAEKVAEDMDTDEIARRVSDNIDGDDVAQRAAELAKDDIDIDSVTERVAENIDWDADVLDYESLARALLKCFAKSIVKS